MGTVLLSGQISALSAPDKDGAVTCRIGTSAVSIHPDLADSVTQSDNVAVAGEVKNNVLHVVALKNFNRGKIAKIDCTPYILFMGAGLFLFVLSGIFSLKGTSGSSLIDSAEGVISIAGLALAVWMLRRTVHAIRAANWIQFAKP
ncbi:MAG TPA: hypothetical protein ENJ19_00655 [Gammaproteobacteria bacterium]|nr:hypothetical protein [Gammaproteobacteria bacterium]